MKFALNRMAAASSQRSRRSRESRTLGAVSLLIGCLVLLPPQIFGGGGSTGTWLGGYLGNVSWNFYQLIKVAMLVVPAGFVLALAGSTALISRWVVRMSAVMVLVALPIAIFAPAGRDALQLLFAIPGLAAGLWLANRIVPSLDRQSIPSEALIRHDAPAIAAAALRDERGTGEPLIKSDAQARIPQPGQTADTTGAKSPVSVGRDAAHGVPFREFGGHGEVSAAASEAAHAVVAEPLPLWQKIARRTASVALLAAAALVLWDFPLGAPALACGYAIYLAILWRYPNAWLVVVPAALPVFDLAFWTGRFFLDEFDLLLMVTLAACLWQDKRRAGWPVRTRWLVGLLAVSVVTSGLIGLVPLQPLDDNAFSSYWSHYNSLRVAKGFAWGVLIWWMAGPEILLSSRFKLFAVGMTIGLTAASLSAVWETWLFTGFRTTTDYRATGSFSSMHTGGGHIETYLALALPFAWALIVMHGRPIVKLAAGAVFLLGTYAILATVARSGLAGMIVLSIVLALGVLVLIRRDPRFRRRAAASAAVITAGVVVLAAGVYGGEFVKRRFATIAEDARIRLVHAGKTLGMMDRSTSTWLVGMGLGSFPRTHLVHNLDEQPGGYRFNEESGNVYLHLNSGGTLYWAQAVPVRSATRYTMELDVRSNGEVQRIEAAVCEKILFNSHRCVWRGVQFAADQRSWQHKRISIDSGEIGSDRWWNRRPVQLQIYNPQRGTVVQIDNVQLIDENGSNVIANGDFSNGGNHWFFKSGNHLPWHIKNVWLHALFEQGVFGVIVVGALFAAALVGGGKRFQQADPTGIALLAATVVALAMGVVESFFDAPRLAALLVFLLLVAAATAGRTAAR